MTLLMDRQPIDELVVDVPEELGGPAPGRRRWALWCANFVGPAKARGLVHCRALPEIRKLIEPVCLASV